MIDIFVKKIKKIKLTQNFYALVDEDDFDNLNKYKWRISKSKSGNYYAIRSKYNKNTKKCEIFKMHREIMKLTKEDKSFVDHKNGNGLDNTKDNLRITDSTGNSRNANKTNKKTKSQYKGVTYTKSTGKWQARISVNGTRLNLGQFTLEIDAAIAYNNAALYYFKEFAKINLLHQQQVDDLSNEDAEALFQTASALQSRGR